MDDSNNNKVTVMISGQEYTISGEKPRDHIIKVAAYVDEIMKNIDTANQSIPTTKLAILAAVNITDEFFSLKDGYSELATEKEQLEKDKDHYIQLWDEAKKSFLQYKEDAQSAADQKESAKSALNDKMKEVELLRDELNERNSKITSLENKVQNFTERLKATQEGETTSTETIKEWEDKYKEIEGSYFELQMENIQLKNDLERYKKIVD